MTVEREFGAVRGLVRALRFVAYPLLCVGEHERATKRLKAAFELAEEQTLVEEAFSAADVLASISVEREEFETAQSWLARADTWADRIGADYARKSLNSQRAKIALASNDPELAARLVGADLRRHARDPLVRQRIINLSILARLFIVRKDFQRLDKAVQALRLDLDLSSTTCRKDYGVATLALGLEALGRRAQAAEYVARYIQFLRRDTSQVSKELAMFANPGQTLQHQRGRKVKRGMLGGNCAHLGGMTRNMNGRRIRPCLSAGTV